MKKLNQKGMSHLLVIVFIVLFAGLAAFALSRTFAARGSGGGGKNNGGSTDSVTKYNYQASDMYGDGLGAVILGSEGKGKTKILFQELNKGSEASLVNNSYSSELASPLNDWTNLNKTKQAKFCVTARSPETVSDLAFSTNNLSDDGTNTAARTYILVQPSSTYQTFCSSPSTIVNPPNASVVFTINMDKHEGSVSTSSGPLRIQSAHWQIVQ